MGSVRGAPTVRSSDRSQRSFSTGHQGVSDDGVDGMPGRMLPLPPSHPSLQDKLADVTGPHFGATGSKAATMVMSVLYLPETAANVRHQHVPSRSACAGQTNCSVMTGAVR